MSASRRQRAPLRDHRVHSKSRSLAAGQHRIGCRSQLQAAFQHTGHGQDRRTLRVVEPTAHSDQYVLSKTTGPMAISSTFPTFTPGRTLASPVFWALNVMSCWCRREFRPRGFGIGRVEAARSRYMGRWDGRSSLAPTESRAAGGTPHATSCAFSIQPRRPGNTGRGGLCDRLLRLAPG